MVRLTRDLRELYESTFPKARGTRPRDASDKAALALRRSLLPYLRAQVAALAAAGTPVMRPLWYDFPDDAPSAAVEDQFMFGPGWMVAPVLEPNATARGVYFPRGARFVDHFTGAAFAGGTNVSVPGGSLQYFPLFAVTREV